MDQVIAKLELSKHMLRAANSPPPPGLEDLSSDSSIVGQRIEHQ
jgi:hypothetical protein